MTWRPRKPEPPKTVTMRLLMMLPLFCMELLLNRCRAPI
jgi:hypothetical protein